MSSNTQAYDKLTFPNKPNYETCTDFLFSKLVTTQLPMPFECGDNVERDIQISYIRAQRELYKHNKILQDKRHKASEMRISLDKQWADLQLKEKNFRRTFKHFNKFVQENNEKRERATLRIQDMQHLYDQTSNEINITIVKLEELKKIKTLMDQGIKDNRIYEKFLSDVIDKYSDNFSSIVDILQRYEALMAARNQLQQLQEADMSRLEQARSTFDKMIDRHLVQLSGLNIKLSDLHNRYEEARSKCLKWENVHNKATLEAIEKVVETVYVKDSCWQIYKDICERKGVAPIYIGDYEKQLEMIKMTILLYERVNEMAQKIADKKQKISIIACASSDQS